MKYAKWIFVVLLISSLTSFVEKDKPTGGLNVGDMAPDFKIQTMSAEQSQTELSDLKGKYVLLSFWASYDAQSRMQNASLSNALRSTARNNVKMVSVSFDEYQSIFEETIRKDQIVTPTCFVETKGEYSGLFKKYRLGRGFTNLKHKFYRKLRIYFGCGVLFLSGTVLSLLIGVILRLWV